MTIPSRDRLLDLLATGLMLARSEREVGMQDSISPKAIRKHSELWDDEIRKFEQAIAEIEEADVPHIDGAGSF